MKHVHILGICGTFMAGIAQIAKQLGWQVSGCDQNVYPPMSTQLEDAGIQIVQGFDASQTDLQPDLYLIGNVVSRGNDLVEKILRDRLPYQSAPQWLYEHVLQYRHILAVSGTHGKTSTSAMLSHILHSSGQTCGYLIGGVAQNFPTSAHLGQGDYFVIEADEYDTAFFDKNAKFLHYRPQTLIINNIEFDHADIYRHLDDITRQFHLLLRQLPDTAKIICPPHDTIKKLLDQGCWSQVEWLNKDWQIQAQSPFEISHNGRAKGQLQWELLGQFNRQNAIAAIAAAHHIGISVVQSLAALVQFKHVKRRQQLIADIHGIRVYDDFAHHPNAIKATLQGLNELKTQGKLIAVFDPASNTMAMGIHNEHLAASFSQADQVLVHASKKLHWDAHAQFTAPLFQVFDTITTLVEHLIQNCAENDTIVVLSNSGANIAQKTKALLEQKWGA